MSEEEFKELSVNIYIRLHDDSANDDCAIDKMAAKFNKLTIQRLFFWKKGQKKKKNLPLTGFPNEPFLLLTGARKYL